MSVLAYVTTPMGTGAHESLSRDLVTALESLGATTVLAEAPARSVNALVAQGVKPVDASCDFADARAATIARSDLLVAVLDGTHPDVLVDIGMAYASGTDCYGLRVDGEVSEGLHTLMLDGQFHSIPDLLALLRIHLRLDIDARGFRMATAEGGTGR